LAIIGRRAEAVQQESAEYIRLTAAQSHLTGGGFAA